MIAAFSFLVALTLSILVTRVAAMALMLTGLSRESARFQARSAFTGVGFTTTEAESVVGHPVRRRIVMLLMLLGNLGIATVVATMLISVLSAREAQNWTWPAIFLTAGLVLLWMLSSSRWVERQLNRAISYGLRKWTQIEVRDYVALLQLQSGYAVSELRIDAKDWLCEQTLIDLRLPDEGVLVLGIDRPGQPYIGTPIGSTALQPDDVLVLYGPIHRLAELDQRRQGKRGDRAHEEACVEHQEVLEETVAVTTGAEDEASGNDAQKGTEA